MIRALKLPAFMTIDAFLAWDAPTGFPWPLVDGVPQAMPPPTATHGVYSTTWPAASGS